ncbi:MAG: DUF134 domain-containing protein [Bacilli bacterium]|jgi:predicted DNA-binding protein (UPF0251 family)/predicted Fe-Mo cluster-binding NifX family protein|nr:DUF134 domain-containing protein [Bacilli bacterium]
MSRPKKNRFVIEEPRFRCFGSKGRCGASCVEMSVDEYETILLLDGKGFSQEETAFRMGVSRTTVTAIYHSARRKIADFLVHGKRLSIAGGCYSVGDGIAKAGIRDLRKGKSNNMKVAVSFDDGKVFQHFGQTSSFKLYEVKEGAVVSSSVEPTNGVSHHELIQWLRDKGVDTLICGGIGGGAIRLLKKSGITCMAGVEGSAEEAVAKLLKNELECVCEPTCHCHDEKR